MTADEAIRFSLVLEDADVYDRLDMLKDVLNALETVADPRTIRKAIKKLLDNAEAFRRSDAPGHATYYEEHLRAAAFACERWREKAAGLAK